MPPTEKVVQAIITSRRTDIRQHKLAWRIAPSTTSRSSLFFLSKSSSAKADDATWRRKMNEACWGTKAWIVSLRDGPSRSKREAIGFKVNSNAIHQDPFRQKGCEIPLRCCWRYCQCKLGPAKILSKLSPRSYVIDKNAHVIFWVPH